MSYGVLNLDKPTGLTSARAVGVVKRLLPRGVKIGHAGTLDPFATGVLLLLVGKATKQCETLMGQPKQYLATIRLGATTETDDLDSPATPTPGAVIPEPDRLAAELAKFVGEIQQRPPAYSALWIAGRRAYDLAREGRPVELQPRAVRIDAVELVTYHPPDVQLRIDCGKGTYIRAIARDLGQALGTGGYLTALRRTRIGPFHVDHAVTLEQLRSDGVEPHLLDPSGTAK
jgi:tRNA pseudouridine55 synthase